MAVEEGNEFLGGFLIPPESRYPGVSGHVLFLRSNPHPPLLTCLSLPSSDFSLSRREFIKKPQDPARSPGPRRTEWTGLSDGISVSAGPGAISAASSCRLASDLNQGRPSSLNSMLPYCANTASFRRRGGSNDTKGLSDRDLCNCSSGFKTVPTCLRWAIPRVLGA